MTSVFLKKIKYMLLFILLSVAAYNFPAPKKHDLPIVAITQIIDHNTLDVVKAGLLEGLKSEGFLEEKTVKIIFDNSHGNLTIASQIAQKFAALSPAVMVGLSTQSAQILQSYAKDSSPLIFSAVTDPVSAKLVESWHHTNKGITGVSDYMEADVQIDMIKAFIPHITELGILYNPAEINSVSFLKTFEEKANKKGIKIVFSPLNSTSEASAATLMLMGRVQAVYFPNDNTAMAAVRAIVSVALKNNIPVFANDLASVQQGATAAMAYDRFEMGLKTAAMVAGLLRGKTTKDYPVTNDVKTEIVYNNSSLTQLKIALPSMGQPIRNVLKS